MNNLIWRPELPNFKHKYEVLSKYYGGMMLHFSDGHRKSSGGKFNFLSIPYHENTLLRYVQYLLFSLKIALRSPSPDYVIAYDPAVFGLFGLLIKFLTRAKLITEVNVDYFRGVHFTSHTTLVKLKRTILYLLTRFVIRRANGVKFVCKDMEEKYRRRFYFSQSTTFFSFISTQVFAADRSRDENYILFVGEPYNLKGVDILIRAFNLLSDDYPDVHLKIIGHCENRSEYEQLVEGNGNVIFQGGTEYDQIIKQFEHCKFLVLPSRTEGIPRVLVEAMACAKPVIGSNVGGIPEVIRDEVNGLLFESENHEMLAEKMRLLLDDPERAAEMGQAGYSTAVKDYSPERYAALYHTFLSSITS